MRVFALNPTTLYSWRGMALLPFFGVLEEYQQIPPKPESQIKALMLRNLGSTSVSDFQMLPALKSLFVNDKASEMQISLYWPIRQEQALLHHLLGPLDWAGSR